MSQRFFCLPMGVTFGCQPCLFVWSVSGWLLVDLDRRLRKHLPLQMAWL